MVDYSKWDRMGFSDSSDSEEGSVNGYPSRPRVTSLQEPGRVTISADGSVQIGQAASSGSTDTTPQPQQQLSSSSALPVVSGSNSGDAVDISSLPDINARDDDHAGDTKQQQQQQQQQQNRQEKVFTRNGGKHFTLVRTKKAQIQLPVYWSQDRYAVTLRIGFSTKQFPSRTIRVHVSGALKYEDRHSAVGSGSMMTDYISKQNNDDDDDDDNNGGNGPSFGSVEVVSISSDDQEETVLFNGLLPRPIHLNQDEEEVEYEIETSACDTIIMGDINDDKEETCCDRFVAIVLPKAVPMHGMVLWWDCPIVGFPKISVASIQDRQTSAAKSSSSSNDEKKEAFEKAWAEAHDMFREKMKKKEKHII